MSVTSQPRPAADIHPDGRELADISVRRLCQELGVGCRPVVGPCIVEWGLVARQRVIGLVRRRVGGGSGSLEVSDVLCAPVAKVVLMAETSYWKRVRAAGQATAIAGELVAQAIGAGAPPPTPPQLSQARSPATTQATQGSQVRSIDELVKDAARWQKERATAERKQAMELSEHLREPSTREVRDR